MRIGYVGNNATIGRSYETFRLKSYSPERFCRAVEGNLDTLQAILAENARLGLLFYRMPSGLIPFASHPRCDEDWASRFGTSLTRIGAFARARGLRLSTHPDQFILLNSPRPDVTARSLAELDYHARLMDGLGLGADAKIQIHVGGLYGDRKAALHRFVKRFRALPQAVGRRLVVENDDRLFGLADVLRLHEETGIPALLDVFHLECLEGETRPREALARAAGTWSSRDGPPMVDYSSQAPGRPRGTHALTLDPAHFRGFLRNATGMDVDVLLEIKDKEKSALRARRMLPVTRHRARERRA